MAGRQKEEEANVAKEARMEGGINGQKNKEESKVPVDSGLLL